MFTRSLVACLVPLSIAGCGNGSPGGGGGGGGGGGPVGDTTAPIVVVSFPPPGARTDTDRVTVRGAAGDPSGVQSIRVNGVVAQSADGFSTWTATVPLAPGANVLRVRAEDDVGNVAFPALQWTVTRVAEPLVLPAAIASDGARARLLVVDAALDLVLAVDLGGLGLTTVSAASSSGIAFEVPTSADVDPGRDRAIVVDRGRNELVAVDLSTGTRSILAGGGGPIQPIDVAIDAFLDVAYVSEVEDGIVVVDLSTGNHEPLGGTGSLVPGIGGLAVDVARARVLATRNGPFPALIAFDSTTGAVSTVSGAGVGLGPALVDPRDVVLDPFQARALVTDAGAGAIVAIDLVTGDRSVLSGPSQGNGLALSEPAQLVVDAFALVDVVDLALDAAVRVEPVNGNRTRLAGTTVGSGIALSRPVSLAQVDGGALVADEWLRALVEVDDATGERRLFSGRGVGGGPELIRPLCVVRGSIFFPARFAFVADDGLDALVVVSSLGERSEFSGPLVGAGPAFLGPRDVLPILAVTPIPETDVDFFFVADCPLVGPGQLLVVDGTTGDRSAVAAGDPALVRPAALALLPLQTDLAVLDDAQDAIVVLHLATGDRSILSGPGQGPAFDPLGPKDMLLDLNGQRLLVADAGAGHVLAVSLATGQRTILSSAAEGSGPRLAAPAGIGSGPPPLSSSPSGSTAQLATRVVDAARGAVFVLGPDGERVVVSK